MNYVMAAESADNARRAVRSWRHLGKRVLAAVSALGVAATTATLAVPGTALASTSASVTFNYTGSLASFTVPASVTQLTLTITGAEGGQGGPDANGPSPTGGYQGVVSGTIAVNPGDNVSIAVGSGGNSGTGGGGVGPSTPGSNPLSGYGGGQGGKSGSAGSSGSGGAGGAATVVQYNSATIVAGGSGGSGGSGQYAPIVGRLAASSYTGRSDTVTPSGQPGINVDDICHQPGSFSCDGGGSGGGGGGAHGGAQGDDEFGAGTSTEWFGYGGFPGQNDTAGFGGLSGLYQFFADNNSAGSVVITYSTGVAGAPTNVGGIAGDGSVGLSWNAPAITGLGPITDYVVEYALASSPTSWTTFAHAVSSATSATVTGLTNGTAYIFRVSAVNSSGQSSPSTSSGSITPSGPPGAPTISSITPSDSSLSVAFSAASSNAPLTDYEYQLDNSGSWISAGATTSPLVIHGLTNGTSYSVKIRAVNAIGAGAASAPMSGTPQALPGAPTITSISTGVGTATVSFTAGYNGGGAITNYQYQLNSGSWVSAGTTTSPISIAGLSNGTTYAIAIRAIAASGNGAASQPASVTTPGIPAAPNVSAVTPGDTSVSIAFAPGNNNGSAITSYQYQLVTAGGWTSAGTLASPIGVTGLTNGTTYNVSLRAINAVGTGAASVAINATPATVPGAPTINGNTVAGLTNQLSAAFTAPVSNGGSAITTYQYSTDSGATWRARDDSGTTATPVVISVLSSDGTTPLVNGITYHVELRAVNAVGPGVASDLAIGIPQSTPDAPIINSVTRGPSSLNVAFTPGSNGGAAVTAYQYSLNAGSTWISTGSLSTAFVITGLANGTLYSVVVRAVNSQGNGAASTSSSGMPSTTPGQATISATTRGNKMLTVAVGVADNGGSAVTGWQYSTDGGSTWGSTGESTSPLHITKLSTDGTTDIVNGSSYPVAVRAVNAVGAGTPSDITNVGPGSAPAAPSVTLTPANQALSVAFTLADDGGSPVTEFDYRLDGGSWVNASTLSSPITVTGLTNGTSYSVEVRADNAIGAGTPSTPASASPADVPDAPTAVGAVAGNAQAVVSWTAPVDNGGSVVTGYFAAAYTAASGGSAIATCSTATTSCTISGLTNATTYYVAVSASNVVGSGVASSPRTSVVPLAKPGAPTLNTLTSGDTLLSAAFTAGSAGTDPITSYQYRVDSGAWQTVISTTSPLVVSGLTNGTSYAVAIRAVSDAGAGPASNTLTQTPYTFPDAPDPTQMTIDNRGGSVLVTWTAPNNNGSAIDTYTAVAFNSPAAGSQISTCTTATLSCTISGLSNGTTYYISVQAHNAAGFSPRSDPRLVAVPSNLPGAVSHVSGTAGNGQVSLSWNTGSQGGSAISDYTVWYSTDGTTYTQFADGTSSATSATVTGLTNGTPYTFEVYAVNSFGTSPVSAPSSAVTPATLPGAPVFGSATPGNASVLLSWSAPVSNGGSAITAYHVHVTGGATTDLGNVTSYRVTGLTNGTPYTFTIWATNGVGDGPTVGSGSATPIATAPTAPTINAATAANHKVTLGWTAPTDDGGSPITGYVITPSVGSPITVGVVTTYPVTGLTNGTGYTFTVAATNVVGTGPGSTVSTLSTPAVSAPDAPTITASSAGNTVVTLTWNAPADDGGSPITGYVVTPSVGSPITLGVVTAYAVTALTNGSSYTFTVAAMNVIGTGSHSTATATLTPNVGGVGGGAAHQAPVRLAGSDRVGTAVAVSQAAFPTAHSAGAVVLARADNYPDALVGTPLAADKNAPLLFASGSELNVATVAELQRVLPAGGTVYLLGGIAAIPASVAVQLNALGYVPVRYAGADRYGTALAVADALHDPTTVLLATGTNFPDALSAGTAAAHVGGVVLLTAGTTMPVAVANYLAAHPGIVYAVGGSAVAADPSATPLAGADRYTTATMVASALFSSPTEIGIASGATFADALTGGAYEAHVGGVLLLSTPATLSDVTGSYLHGIGAGVATSHLFAGTTALSTQVQVALGAALGF